MPALKNFLTEAQALPRNILAYLYSSVRGLPDNELNKIISGVKGRLARQATINQTGLPENVLSYIDFYLKRANMNTAMRIVDGVDNFVDAHKATTATTSSTGYNKLTQIAQAMKQTQTEQPWFTWIVPLQTLYRQKQLIAQGNTKQAATHNPGDSLERAVKRIPPQAEQLMRDMFAYAQKLPPEKILSLMNEIKHLS